jgi:hypothetical protein
MVAISASIVRHVIEQIGAVRSLEVLRQHRGRCLLSSPVPVLLPELASSSASQEAFFEGYVW